MSRFLLMWRKGAVLVWLLALSPALVRGQGTAPASSPDQQSQQPVVPPPQRTGEQRQPEAPGAAVPNTPAVPKPQEPSQPQQPQPAPPPAESAPQTAPALPIPGAPTLSQPGVTPIQGTDDEIVLMAVGDVMLGTTFPDASGGDLPPNDGADLLQEVAPILKNGDVIFGNLEGPLVDSGVSAKCRGKREGTCYAFRVPTRYGKYLKDAGFSVMGVANNHAMDFGQEGRSSSRQVLDSLGIAHTGEIGDIAHLTVKGRKIAVIAFATYPNAYNLLNLDEALQVIRDARAESDIVIVSFHGGAEGATHQHVPPGDEMFLGEDRGDLRKFTHAAIDAGAQVVVGSGPHVVRGMEIYQGNLIAYSLGNFATYGPFNLSGENGISLILEAHLGLDGSFRRGKVYPVKQEKPGGPKLDPEMKIVPVLRDLSSADFGENSIIVSSDGELSPPVRNGLPEEKARAKSAANERQ